MIDTHCHLIPALDDGARNLEESLRMLEAARADGVTRIVATPHLYLNHDLPGQEQQAREAFERFLDSLNQAGPPSPAVDLGGENRLTPGFLAVIPSGNCIALGRSQWILVEVPSSMQSSTALRVMDTLDQAGLRMVWAHAERSRELQANPDRAFHIAEQGVALQVTTRGLFGEWGAAAKKTAEQLLRRRCVHLLASDAHDAARRPPILSAGVEQAAKILGSIEDALRLVQGNPQTLLDGGDLLLDAP